MRDTVLVTGGSRGIGRAIIERLHADGYAVVNLDLQAPERLASSERHVQVDVSDEHALKDALQHALSAGPITRLVNNAGIVMPGSIEDARLDDLNAVMAVNVGASLLCVQALLPGMKQAGFGRIVNVSSRAALGKPQRISYATSKAGLHGFTKALALEVARHGITVNAVGPGPIATELFQKVNPANAPQTQRILENIPMRRMGDPSEVAHLIVSLLDDRAGFVTGQVVYVCGGMTLGLAT